MDTASGGTLEGLKFAADDSPSETGDQIMLRKLLLVAATVMLPSVLVVVIEPGIASAGVVAVGTANCNGLAGKGFINPSLTVAGANGGMKINFKAKFGPCPNANFTAPVGDIIKGGSLKGSGFYSNNLASKCGNYFGSLDTIGNIKVTIKWKAKPVPIANTVLTYAAAPFEGAPAGVITLTAPPPPAAVGSFEPAAGPVPPLNTITLPSNLACAGPHNFLIAGGNVNV